MVATTEVHLGDGLSTEPVGHIDQQGQVHAVATNERQLL